MEITSNAKQKAIFLDRDGVINRERGDYTWKIEDFEFNPGLIKALKILQLKSYRLFVITNQGGIAKGLYGHDQLQRLHQFMIDHLLANGIHIADVFYCPHHPTTTNCLCRKPGSLMLERAISRYNIDPSISYLFGDRERDCEAARTLGVEAILTESNDNLGKYLHLVH